MNYISYEDYMKFGGKCDEDTFPTLQFEVESKLNYITFGNINQFMTQQEQVPECFIRLEVELINILEKDKATRVNDKLSSYSNGIESFGYDTSKKNETIILDQFKELAQQYLHEYPELFYRGRWLYHAR